MSQGDYKCAKYGCGETAVAVYTSTTGTVYGLCDEHYTPGDQIAGFWRWVHPPESEQEQRQEQQEHPPQAARFLLTEDGRWWWCIRCGALVGDRTMHQGWHLRIGF
jgi:hypothetical protein